MRTFACMLLVALWVLTPYSLLSKEAPKVLACNKEEPREVVDINHATAAEFETLPGIGPELARRIVAFREKHGPFRRVEDLLAIKGIGRKKWKAIRPYLKLSKAAGRTGFRSR